ncbi:MAG TPA: hypothetical protein PK127_02770 [Clostridiales bacterium]|nr:hypothetical protein [Clostridiales bacterium]HPV01391.1 hypothetical protein [Clostridiales bacterium]
MKLIRFVNEKFISKQEGFGLNELLGIAAALIIAGFIVIPQMQSFAKNLMEGLAKWWNDIIYSRIFPSSL